MKFQYLLPMLFAYQSIFAEVSQKEVRIQFLPTDGKTTFLATGRPAMIKIAGEGEGPQGIAIINNSTLDLTLAVEIAKITTKIDLRDEHLKNKYLEMAKYPQAILTIKNLKLNQSFQAMTDKDTVIPFVGELNLHGITKPISGSAKVQKSGKIVSGSAEFKLPIEPHLEALPSYLGIKVADIVDVNIEFKGTVTE